MMLPVAVHFAELDVTTRATLVVVLFTITEPVVPP